MDKIDTHVLFAIHHTELVYMWGRWRGLSRRTLGLFLPSFSVWCKDPTTTVTYTPDEDQTIIYGSMYEC